jgi:hypothetical protein
MESFIFGSAAATGATGEQSVEASLLITGNASETLHRVVSGPVYDFDLRR